MKRLYSSILLLIVLTLVVVDRAQALSLDPGYDLFTIKGGSFIAVDFDGPGGLDPVPVFVKGQPVHGSLFNTDLIIQRKGGADPFNAGDELIIPVEIVALSLHSVSPVIVDSTAYDVQFLSGSLLSNPASPLFKQDTIPANPDGSGQIKKVDNFGGTFSSFFDVFFEVQITDINDPSNSDKLYEQYKLFIEQAPWVETPGHTYPSIPDFPSGNFYAQDALAQGEGASLSLTPASTPEPASLLLFGAGAVGAFLRRRKT
jgi:hypothetical protein